MGSLGCRATTRSQSAAAILKASRLVAALSLACDAAEVAGAWGDSSNGMSGRSGQVGAVGASATANPGSRNQCQGRTCVVIDRQSLPSFMVAVCLVVLIVFCGRDVSAQNLDKQRLYRSALMLTETSRPQLLSRMLSFQNPTEDERRAGLVHEAVDALMQTTAPESIDWANKIGADSSRSRALRAAATAVLITAEFRLSRALKKTSDSLAQALYARIPRHTEMAALDALTKRYMTELQNAAVGSLPIIPPEKAPPARFTRGELMEELSTGTLLELRETLRRASEGETSTIRDVYSAKLLLNIYVDQSADTEFLTMLWRNGRYQRRILETLSEAKNPKLVELGRSLVREVAESTGTVDADLLYEAVDFLEIIAIRGWGTKDVEEYLVNGPGRLYPAIEELCGVLAHSRRQGISDFLYQRFQRCMTRLDSPKTRPSH